MVQLLKTGGGAGDDQLYQKAWNAIGDYYADRQKVLIQILTYKECLDIFRERVHR